MNCLSRKKYTTGTTLVEILVGLGVFSLMVIVLMSFFIYGTNSWHLADSKIHTSREAIVSLEDLSTYLSQSSESSIKVLYYTSISPVVIDTGDPRTAPCCAISFLTPYDEAGTFLKTAEGDPQWKAYIIFYVNPNDGPLRRKRVELPAAIDVPLPMEDDAFKAQLDGDGRILAEFVKEFRLIDASGATSDVVSAPSNPMCLRIRVEKPDNRAATMEVLEVKRIIRLFN